MTAKLILNPYANRWNALNHLEQIKLALNTASLEYDLSLTETPGHGTTLAYQAVKCGYSPIISAGGDGSVSEVVNGMMMVWKEDPSIIVPPLGIIPLGSVNDLAHNLKLPENINEAIEVINLGKSKKYDLGKVNNRFFDNNSAVGLEPEITLIQQKIKHIHGAPRYLIATIIGIIRNQNWDMQLEWDSSNFTGKVTLVTVGNNPLTGGLFYMTPGADPNDGLLTFTYGHIPGRFNVLRVLPNTMKTGKGSYIENPNIHQIHTKWLRIKSIQPTALHADGEIIAEKINEVEYQVIPSCLPILS